jgi:hypothetical protein
MPANGIPFASSADAINNCEQLIHKADGMPLYRHSVEVVMLESPRLTCRAEQRLCQSVEELATARLHDDVHFRGRDLNLSFELTNGVLTIRGSVPSFYLKQLLQTVLKEMERVNRIENRVDVISSDGLSSVRSADYSLSRRSQPYRNR